MYTYPVVPYKNKLLLQSSTYTPVYAYVGQR